jgi:hypothetical protein
MRQGEDTGQGGGRDDSQRGSDDGEGRRCGHRGSVLRRRGCSGGRGCSRQGSAARGRSEDVEAQMKLQGKALEGGDHREEATTTTWSNPVRLAHPWPLD